MTFREVKSVIDRINFYGWKLHSTELAKIQELEFDVVVRILNEIGDNAVTDKRVELQQGIEKIKITQSKKISEKLKLETITINKKMENETTQDKNQDTQAGESTTVSNESNVPASEVHNNSEIVNNSEMGVAPPVPESANEVAEPSKDVSANDITAGGQPEQAEKAQDIPEPPVPSTIIRSLTLMNNVTGNGKEITSINDFGLTFQQSDGFMEIAQFITSDNYSQLISVYCGWSITNINYEQI